MLSGGDAAMRRMNIGTGEEVGEGLGLGIESRN